MLLCLCSIIWHYTLALDSYNEVVKLSVLFSSEKQDSCWRNLLSAWMWVEGSWLHEGVTYWWPLSCIMCGCIWGIYCVLVTVCSNVCTDSWRKLKQRYWVTLQVHTISQRLTTLTLIFRVVWVIQRRRCHTRLVGATHCPNYSLIFFNLFAFILVCVDVDLDLVAFWRPLSFLSRADCRVVRIDPLRFLAKCHKRR